jgi:hypothetical protein
MVRPPKGRLAECCVFCGADLKSRAVDWELRASILVVLPSFNDTEVLQPTDEEALMYAALFVLCDVCCNPATSEHASGLVPGDRSIWSGASTCTTSTWNVLIAGGTSISRILCQSLFRRYLPCVHCLCVEGEYVFKDGDTSIGCMVCQY